MLKANSYKRGVLWMVLFNGIARCISFVLGIILAKNFLPAETDIYLYVWSIINIILMIVSGVNLLAAGPEYIRLCETGDKKGAADLNNALINIYLLPLVIFSLFTLLLPVATYNAISGFNEAQLIPYRQMLRFSGCWLVLMILNNFLGNVLLSRKYFVGSVLGQVMAAGLTLLFILIFKTRLGIDSFLIGQLIGNLLCLFFYIYQLRTRIQEKFRPFYFRLSSKVRKQLAASFLIAIPTLFSNFILVYMLSHFVTGQLSAYNYGSTLSNLPDVIIVSQFISVIGVKFSEISAGQQRDTLFNALRYFGSHLFFCMSGLAVIIALLSPMIIQVIYGKENLGEPVFRSSVLTLTLLSSTLAFRSLDVLHNRMFASLQALIMFMKYTIPMKLFSIGLLVLLAWQFGFEGILVHQLSMPVIMVALEFYLLRNYLPVVKIRSYLRQIILLFLGSVAMYFIGRFLLDYIFRSTPALLQITVVCILALVMGILFEKIFKITMLFEVVMKRLSLFFNAPVKKGEVN